MEFRYDYLTFSDGSRLEVPPDGIVVLVGPNNAGKSAALREILSYLQSPAMERRIVTGAAVTKDGSGDGFADWLQAHTFVLNRADGRYFRRSGVEPVREDIAKAQWENPDPYGQNIWPFLAFHAAADQRLALLSPSGPYDPINDAPSTPMQVLFAKPELEDRLSTTAFEAFGDRLTLSRIWGAQLDLHVGTIDIEPSVVPNRDYIEAIQALPPVNSQGDGMRSFIGLMMALITAQYPLVLVDEPEAFLHPPQARLLGRKLVTEAPGGTQLFVATHSLDVLQGLLDPPNANVTVVRIVRRDAVNPIAVLAADDLRRVWRDPLLRYSNVLEGLFHKGVVVSEADTDSRFYAAVLDESRSQADQPPHELLFTQSGGKQRLRTVIRALRAVKVPVAVISDIDILREEVPLRSLVEELGGSWADFAGDWRQVHAAINDFGQAPLLLTVREEVTEALAGEDAVRLSRQQAQRVRDVTRLNDGWDRVKNGGIGALPQGQASERAGICSTS